MASRAVPYWRSVAGHATAFRQLSTAVTTAPRANPLASLFSDVLDTVDEHRRWARGEFVPVYVALGMIMMSTTLGLYTAKHQLAYAPNVRVSKKRRETVPEVVEPERVVKEADCFIHKSLFRRIAHVQDFDALRAGIGDPARPHDPLHVPRKVEDLKTVGVDPRAQ